MIRFVCPQCSTPYSAADEHAGKRTTCKKCGAKFHIPHAGAESAPVPPSLPYSVEVSAPPSAPLPEREPSLSPTPPAPEPPPLPPEVPVELKPCPKCGAKMSVRPDDVGYDIQCPFCQTTFRGEAASIESASAPTAPTEAPPPPAPEPEGVEIAPCPKCRAELTVAPDDVGGEVECPFCQTVYLAEKPKPKPNTLLARPSARPATTVKPQAPPPPKGKKGDDDDEKSPIRMKVEVERDNDDDEDDDYRPRKKRKKRRRRSRSDPYDSELRDRVHIMEPSDGIHCLILGLLSFFCCVIIAFWAIPKCRDTMSKVDSGVMDSSAKTPALVGLIFAYLGIALFVLNLVGNCVFAGIGGGAGGGR
jgi:DNA-directed RNA polymerase subunit M/transcription elongation factor TFIIS